MQGVGLRLDQTVQDPIPPVCAIFLTNSAAYITTVLAALRLGWVPFLPGRPAQPCAAPPTALHSAHVFAQHVAILLVQQPIRPSALPSLPGWPSCPWTQAGLPSGCRRRARRPALW